MCQKTAVDIDLLFLLIIFATPKANMAFNKNAPAKLKWNKFPLAKNQNLKKFPKYT